MNYLKCYFKVLLDLFTFFRKKINLKQVTTFKKEIAISITVMRQNEGNRVSFKALACRNSLLVYGSHHVEQVRTLLQCEAN